jgi:hypothetical protein
LHQFDYLSTVSGGGYFGSFLSTFLRTGERVTLTTGDERADQIAEANKKRIKETFWSGSARETQPGEGRRTQPEAREGEAGQRREPPPLRHLRNRSRYLVDGGFVQKALDIGMVVAGVLFNMLILLPVPLAAALFTLGLYKSDLLGDYDWARETNRWLPRLDAPWSIVLLVLLGLTALGLLLYPWLKTLSLKTLRKEPKSALLPTWTKVFSWVVGLTLFALAWWMVPLGFHLYYLVRSAQVVSWLGTMQGNVEKLLAMAGVSATAILGALASRANVGGRLGALLKGLAILSVFFISLYTSEWLSDDVCARRRSLAVVMGARCNSCDVAVGLERRGREHLLTAWLLPRPLERMPSEHAE